MKKIVTVNFYVAFMKSFGARQPNKMLVKFVPTGAALDHLKLAKTGIKQEWSF